MRGKSSVPISREEARLALLLAQGLHNLEIASILRAAPGAVESRVRRLRRRAGAADRVELALFGVASLPALRRFTGASRKRAAA